MFPQISVSRNTRAESSSRGATPALPRILRINQSVLRVCGRKAVPEGSREGRGNNGDHEDKRGNEECAHDVSQNCSKVRERVG
jgi:hypothetical protein